MSSSVFTELRRVIWPIEVSEYKKFLPTGAMMFCILFNYSMFRSIKDGFVVSEIGAEAISFLKTYFVLPSALLATIAYIKICNSFDTKRAFYIITGAFVAYIALFTFVFYPNPSLVHPNPETIERWVQELPRFKWFIRIMGKWSFATFYIIAELWGTLVISVLFWQFANQITKTEEAKRFYSMFGILGNLGLICTDIVISHFLGKNAASSSLPFIPVLSFSIGSCLLLMLIYKWINDNVLTDPKFYQPNENKAKKSKVNLTMGESFKMIFSSKYLGMIAILIIAYGVSINLVEGIWKSKLQQLYTTKESYTVFMGNFQKWQGIAAILMYVVGANVLRKLSWKTAAMFTPLMILLTGLGFFGFIFFEHQLAFLTAVFMIQPLAIAALFGTIQNILSKAVKYSLFDATKEMAYIPLNDDLKSKGKSAVELLAGRGGKTGGGIIQSTFFILFPSLGFTEASPYFGGIFFVIVIMWLYAVNALSKDYYALVDQDKQTETAS